VHVGSPSSPEILQELLRVADGRPQANGDALWDEWSEPRWCVMHYGNIGSLVVFVVVIFWPALWLRADIRRAKAARS
jgi:hypothetical protein